MMKHAANLMLFISINISEDQIGKAELKMAMLCVKNNIPFSFVDNFNCSVADMFPDSAIALKYSAGETKAT